MKTTDTLTVSLTAEQWKIIAFLVRRGAMSELEQQMLNPMRHSTDCISGFVAAHIALSEQLPEIVPQTPKPSEGPGPTATQ